VLKVLEDHGTVSDAARAVGVTRCTVYEWRNNDAAFDAAVHAAQEDLVDKLEQAAVDLALNGYEEITTITDASGVTTQTRVTHRRDPGMLRFHLTSRRRGTYGVRQEIQHSGEITTKRIVWGESDAPEGPAL